MPSTPHKPHRVFFALLPQAQERLRIAEFCRQQALHQGRAVSAANWHVTLAFLGEVDAAALEALLESRFPPLPPFVLSFGQLAYFPRPKVLVLEPLDTPEALQQLAAACRRRQGELRLHKSDKDYRPHLTLARDYEPPVAAAAMQPPLDWRVQEFALMESLRHDGELYYRALRRWPLQRPLRPSPR